MKFLGGKIKDLSEKDKLTFPTYQHRIAQSICNPATVKCHLGKCSVCPGDKILKEVLLTAYYENKIENITYKQWVKVDRSNLTTVTMPVEEFVDILAVEMNKLTLHSFIAKEQSKCLQEIKENLDFGEFLTICDFAENYSFIIQYSIQSFHWNNSQATVHPFVAYFKNDKGDIDHISFVIISDISEHNTIAVYLFQKKFISFLKENFNQEVKKIIYFSDGCAGQYKNRKYFINLTHHETDFGCKAEWHFFVTSHGKGP